MTAHPQRVIYVAGPYRARNNQFGYNFYEQHVNIEQAEALAWRIWECGHVALCPHANTRNYQGSLPDETWLQGDLTLLERCDAVLMTPDWERSIGARGERDYALRHGIRVFTTFDALKSWLLASPRP